MKLRSKHLTYIGIAIVVFVILYALKNTAYFVRASAFVSSLAVFWIVDTLLDLKFRVRHYVLLVFIATTGILLSPFYYLYPGYDKVLHFFNPILFSILIFYLVNKIKGISFSKKLFLTFSITVSFLALFELIEFFLDKMYDLNLQGVYIWEVSETAAAKVRLIMDRNDDTMIDLALGVLGTVLFSIGKTIEIYYKKLNKKKTK